MAFAAASGVLPPSGRGMRAAMAKPSASISRTVIPWRPERCVPDTKSSSSSCRLARILFRTGSRRP